MAASVTLKVSALDHQALTALLGYLAGKVEEDEFRAVLSSQGRKVSGIPVEELVRLMAGQLIGAVR